MEFFEKAHVVCKKSTKEEFKKKQLKQMLQGYKQNDNDAIKTSANKKTPVEETFSISSFSEADFMNVTEDSENNRESRALGDSDTADTSFDAEDSNPDISISSDESSETPTSSSTDWTVSNRSQESVSFSGDVSTEHGYILAAEEQDIGRVTSDENETEDVLSSDENSVETVTEDSQPFDSDGTLASKIKKKLGKRGDISEAPVLAKKVKLNKQKNDNESWIVRDLSHLKISKIKLDEASVSSESTIEGSSEEYASSSSVTRRSFNGSDSSETGSNTGTVTDTHNEEEENSEPFVTMKAPEFICGSLSAILSDYKCPITKVLPYESRTVPVTSSKIFTSDIVDTGLKGSDEESDQFIEQFDTNVEVSVIDETETPVHEQSLISQETNDLSEEAFNEDEEVAELDNSFTEEVKVFYGKSDSCILVMKHPTEIHIHGKVRVNALGGTAEILGFTLKNNSYDVYAPYHSHSQYLRTVEVDNNNYGLFGRLTSSGLTVAEAEDIVTTLGDHDVVVKLQKLTSRKIEFVEENFSSDLFSKPSKYIDSCFIKASQMLGCSLYLTAPWKRFEENRMWSHMVQKTDNKSRGIIAGGKGCGKSTLLRYSVNKLLATGPVLVIDLDPGQSELTPAGNVSATVVTEPLLGPNFTHLKTPDMMLNIGVINVMDNLNRYANAVTSLMAHCAREPRYQNIPWLVNTMGLCNTVGLKIMTLIVLLLRPTFLIQMDSKNVKKRFEEFLNPHSVKRLYFERYRYQPWFRRVECPEGLEFSFAVSEPRAGGGHALPPRDERYLCFLAYFGELLEQHKDVDFLGIVPYKVPLQRFKIWSNVKFEEDAITKVINGKIVALCEDAGGDNRRKLFTLDDKPLRCHGYGLVRGVEADLLFVSAGAARAALPAVGALLVADWTPELRAERRLRAGTALPYRAASEHAHKQLLLTPRRRFNPLQLLKMSRSS